VDLLFVPVGGGPTIGASAAVESVARLAPRWAVPMHYRTPRIGFLEDAEEFLGAFTAVRRLDTHGVSRPTGSRRRLQPDDPRAGRALARRAQRAQGQGEPLVGGAARTEHAEQLAALGDRHVPLGVFPVVPRRGEQQAALAVLVSERPAAAAACAARRQAPSVDPRAI
jgi:Beta-lactamase superfamily domain